MSIAQLKSYMQATGLRQPQVAAQLGKSTAVVNQYLQGKYAGDTESLDKDVAQLVQRYLEKIKDVKTDFVETPTAKRILEICGMAHAMVDIHLVIGGAGLGKTIALRHYAKNNSNVIMIETDPTFTAKVLLTELCQMLGVVAGKNNNHSMMEAIIEKLKGSDKLLIIDEAELLAYKPLEILRRIHDKAGVGIVLAGLPQLRTNLRGSKGEYKQLYSRVGMVLDLKNQLPETDIAMLCETALGVDIFNNHFNRISKGNARRLNKLLRGVNRMALLNGGTIDDEMIERFSEMLID